MTPEQPSIVASVAPYVADVAIAVLTAVVAWVSRSLAELIRAKASSASQAAVLGRLSEAVTTAVLEVAQTTRADLVALSKDGRISKSDGDQLRRSAIQRAHELLAERGMAELVRLAGSVTAANRMVSSQIERAVIETKPLVRQSER